jgi:hypothetical protein
MQNRMVDECDVGLGHCRNFFSMLPDPTMVGGKPLALSFPTNVRTCKAPSAQQNVSSCSVTYRTG